MKTLKTLALVAATVLLASCSCGQKECKFNAKKYAECKTEKLDKIVDLDDAQEKAVYAVYLKEGKAIANKIKECKKAGSRASNGITNDLDIRFNAQRRRKALSSDSGTNRSPTKDISHTFAGLMSMETYDRIRSPATMLINRRDVIPNILYLAIEVD